jgi:hypothetical protein
MDDAAVRQHVRRRIADGRLPCDRIGRVSATYAADETCAACSTPVSAPQILYKLARADSPELTFHSACFTIWKAERDAYVPRPGRGSLSDSTRGATDSEGPETDGRD